MELKSENENDITKEDVEAKIARFKQMITSDNSYLIRELMHELVVIEAYKDEIELRLNLGSIFNVCNFVLQRDTFSRRTIINCYESIKIEKVFD